MNINELKKILLEFNIDIEKWDHNKGTKTLEELYHEIEAQETTLEVKDNKLFRVLKIVCIQVQIRLGDKLFNLVEDKQIFFTGVVRKRELGHISEKIKGEESPELTAYRALKEEIGLNVENGLIFIQETSTLKPSSSYPNLNSVYKIYRYKIILNTQQLELIQFSEYQKNQGKITLFTLEETTMDNVLHTNFRTLT